MIVSAKLTLLSAVTLLVSCARSGFESWAYNGETYRGDAPVLDGAGADRSRLDGGAVADVVGPDVLVPDVIGPDGGADAAAEDRGPPYDWSSALVLHLRVDTAHGITYDEVSASQLMTDYSGCGTDSVDRKEGDQSLDLHAPDSEHLYANDDVLPVGFPASLGDGSADFLITWWANMDDKLDDRVMVSKWRALDGDRGFAFAYWLATDRFGVRLRDAADSVNFDSSLTALVPSVGVWYHFGAWHSSILARVGLRIWDDAAQQVYDQTWDWTGGTQLNDRPFSVGTMRNSDTAWTAAWSGHLDQIVVYRGVPADEVAIEAKIDSIRQGGVP